MSFETQNRVARPASGSSSRRLHATATLFVLGTALLAGGLPAKAANEGYTVSPDGKTIEIWGTGRDSTGGARPDSDFTRTTAPEEANWKLIAFPDDNIGVGYKLVPTGSTGKLYIPGTLPANWYNQTGGANTAVSGNRFITYANWPSSSTSSYGTTGSPFPTTGGNPNLATSYFNPNSGYTANNYGGGAVTLFTTGTATDQIPDYITTPDPYYYSYIAQTSFTPTVAGSYTFTTNITADNFIEVYLGGTVVGAGTVRPSIDINGGGVKLLQMTTQNGPGLFGSLYEVKNTNVNLAAGTLYTLNYVIRDNATTSSGTRSFGQTGFLVSTTAFTYNEPATTPGPLPALGLAAFLQQSRRLRRRIARAS